MFVTRFHITGERKAERSDKSKPKAKARVSAESAPVKYWEIIADNLSKAGWSWGCVSAVDSRGRTIFVADAHREDSQRFIVRADEKLTAFVELESAIRAYRKSHYVVFLQINR